MKKLLSFLFSLVILASCTKSHDDVNSRPGAADSKIEFQLDGNLKTYVDVNAGVDSMAGSNVYTFVGTKSPQGANIFTISFSAHSLIPGTYNLNNGVITFREADLIVTNVASAGFYLKINSNVNGLINGTFYGTLYNHTTGLTSQVVQGVIENIQLQ